MSEKWDAKKDLDSYRAPGGRFRVVEVPELRYLAVDGHGDPNTAPAFAEAIAALQPVSWTLKLASKERGRDYVVPPLEGLWWARHAAVFTTARDKSAWDWTLLMLVPEWLDAADVDAALAQVRDRSAPARLDDVRLETLAEGLAVQTLHVGSFDDEAETIARMHDEFLPAHGLRPTGRHHEIYLSDFRRVAPERRRTVVRQPVARVAG
ncbi:GyrI-like domain-containing protein [Cellulomonas hominis]|uniref:GyrI-like domain-containing protein n=1 Tax=Cellulomonas hominis TaxID=156981 RepID=UPI001C0FF25F|nr:GyrI-like domain-containing protein [Cellulomonas hominis]MBU5422431.1 GyrI-like domain-containing protein [Cellulomonas hominis]